MKFFILLLYFTLNVFALEKTNIENKVIRENPKIILESISKYAIKIGTGQLCKAYIFVDPMCPFSRNLIQAISKNKLAQAVNSYYIFLYKLPKFDSAKISQYIYQSDDALSALQQVMVEEKSIDLNNVVIDKNVQELVENVANVGVKLKAKIRPYIMKFEEGSKYCMVSSGSAPCMEEFDFE